MSIHSGLTSVIIVIACAVLIILIVLVYLRSRQGDQRFIRAMNQVLLPLLSAIVITLGFIYNNAGVCTQGVPGILRYVAAIGAVLIFMVGVVPYPLTQNRDRRLITHPVLFDIVLVLAILIIEQLASSM